MEGGEDRGETTEKLLHQREATHASHNLCSFQYFICIPGQKLTLPFDLHHGMNRLSQMPLRRVQRMLSSSNPVQTFRDTADIPTPLSSRVANVCSKWRSLFCYYLSYDVRYVRQSCRQERVVIAAFGEKQSASH